MLTIARRGAVLILGLAALAAGLSAPEPAAAVGRQPVFAPQVPGIAINADGRMELFAVNDRGRLEHNWEHFAGSGADPDGFSGWDGIGGDWAVVAPVTVLRRPDNRLQAYARGRDNALWEVHQTNFGIWSGWARLGGRIVGGPSAALVPDGRIVIYARGADNTVTAYTERAANNDGYWVDRLEGGLVSGDPVAVVRPGGQLEGYARGMDNRLYRFVDDLGSVNVAWQYDINSQPMTSRPGIGFEGGLVKAFMIDRQAVFASRQTSLAPARWVTQYGVGYGAVGDPAVTQDSGQIRVYARFSDGIIRQFNGAGWTSGLGPVDIRFGGSPAAFTTGNVQHVAAIDVEGHLRYARRGGDGIFKPWRQI